ncbi:MAG: prepilin-type N-terminal cleavage/methylation domain-containing protein [Lachnospiraceae bacterium]|nr:prepilin-type N-terminal cleavage/methylation domain-containing protein [Lachnospiraceae bacterium]
MKLKKFKNDKSGFSLLEVVISVAVLAIISIPLLMYFSNSAAFNERARVQQGGTLVGDSVVEELKSATYDITSKGAVSANALGGGWEDGQVITYADGTTSNEIYKKVMVDNKSYLAVANLTPVKQYSSQAGVDYSYVDYKLNSMDEKKDVFATDTQLDMASAKQFFYDRVYTYALENPGVSKPAGESDIKDNDIDRSLKITIKGNGDYCDVRIGDQFDYKTTGSYYSYLGTSTSYDYVSKAASIKKSVIEEDGMNVYLFYDARNTGDSLILDVDTDYINGLSSGKVNIFIVRQDKSDDPTFVPTTYNLSVTSMDSVKGIGSGAIVGNPNRFNVATNIETGIPATIMGVAVSNELAEKETDVSRLCRATVRVYKIDGAKEGKDVYDSSTGAVETVYSSTGFNVDISNPAY